VPALSYFSLYLTSLSPPPLHPHSLEAISPHPCDRPEVIPTPPPRPYHCPKVIPASSLAPSLLLTSSSHRPALVPASYGLWYSSLVAALDPAVELAGVSRY
jgi:hypothetical protein